jgi:hypothetical protein
VLALWATTVVATSVPAHASAGFEDRIVRAIEQMARATQDQASATRELARRGCR